TVPSSKRGPLTPRPTSSANGVTAGAHRAITSSNGQCFSGKCEWARTSRISAPGRLRNRPARRQPERRLLEVRRVEEEVPRLRLRHKEEHQRLLHQRRNKVRILPLQHKVPHPG